MFIGSPEIAAELGIGKQRYRNIALRELASVERPAHQFKQTPIFTLDGLISGAATHMEAMQAQGHTVSRRHAIDQVFRIPGRPSHDSFGRLQSPPEFDVDEATATERRSVRVPHFVDPELVFKTVANETSIPQSADTGPSIDHYEAVRARRIAHGTSPLEASYQGAIDMVLAEWEMRDRIQAEAAALEAAREEELARTRRLDAWRESVNERRLDRPRRYGERVRQLP